MADPDPKPGAIFREDPARRIAGQPKKIGARSDQQRLILGVKGSSRAAAQLHDNGRRSDGFGAACSEKGGKENMEHEATS